MAKPIVIPNRFESLAQAGLEPKALIFPVEQDLSAIASLVELIRVQSSGILAFLLGATGIGKTTAAHAASVHLNNDLHSVFLVPPHVELRSVAAWLRDNLPGEQAPKIHPVLFDGREVTDDTVGLRQLLASLNQLLRERNDLLFLWPTTDSTWHEQIRDLARTIGGSNFVPFQGDLTVAGPTRDDWPQILERLFVQLDLTHDDVALTPDMIEEVTRDATTIGDYLGMVGAAVAKRTTSVQIAKSLPTIVFAISSGPEVVGEANRIRRAGSQILKAEELVAYSPRSESGKWWKARAASPEHHLAYIISLFGARLTTLTANAVAYACLHHGEPSLRTLALDAGMKKHAQNATSTLKATDFYRFMTGERLVELTSSRKGGISASSLAAYGKIQALSAKQHKSINQALCNSLAEHVDVIDPAAIKYEVDAGDQNLYTDAILPLEGQKFYLEFHHLSVKNCVASGMASYIMDKLHAYAIHYNLIPR